MTDPRPTAPEPRELRPCPYCRAPMHPAMEDRYGACCPDHGDVVEAREEADELRARIAELEAARDEALRQAAASDHARALTLAASIDAAKSLMSQRDEVERERDEARGAHRELWDAANIVMLAWRDEYLTSCCQRHHDQVSHDMQQLDTLLHTAPPHGAQGG
jgi:uncharacterized Zn finger protein (UPF0148 family)